MVILARLDFGGAPHRNPDGEEIASPHLHVYREGFGDKWAFPVPTDTFTDLADLWRTLQNFMHYCNIVELPGDPERNVRVIDDVQTFLDQYWAWLRDKTTVRTD